ncbi:hypothetical protein CMUS01_13499 [Colletotrichum musicola]|uniref:Histone chaperone domain-containing protein n=1 Tax=Colletotrichum musicola TaxID=2175873 RepID=A0A8H6JCZ8_9PEZI|nr:hypothetical protein CMUS01_13499 [Colletotrichum musicola]
MSSNEAPTGDFKDNSYVSRPGQTSEPIRVQRDTEKVEDPLDAATADSDAQLERDDKDAIDKSNIIEERTRSAKPMGEYREPGDTEGLERERLE